MIDNASLEPDRRAGNVDDEDMRRGASAGHFQRAVRRNARDA